MQSNAAGVVVCEEWHNFEAFLNWFKINHIEGFALDKDFLAGVNKEYSPKVCVFIPQTLNSLLAHSEVPVVEKYKRGSFTLRCYISCKYTVFKGTSEEDCLEQYHLIRKLQLEKLVWMILDYHNKLKMKYLKDNNPNSPEIDTRVIEKLSKMIA